MLIIARKAGKQVIIGDDSLVTVMSVDTTDPVNPEVKLGFDTSGEVKRVDRPETVLKAAKIKATATRGMLKNAPPMEEPPVYVASSMHEEEPKIKAALSRSSASYPESELIEVNNSTYICPAYHQFLVIRCASQREEGSIKKLGERLFGWNFLDREDNSEVFIYLLFIRTTITEGGADVEYVDTVI